MRRSTAASNATPRSIRYSPAFVSGLAPGMSRSLTNPAAPPCSSSQSASVSPRRWFRVAVAVTQSAQSSAVAGSTRVPSSATTSASSAGSRSVIRTPNLIAARR